MRMNYGQARSMILALMAIGVTVSCGKKKTDDETASSSTSVSSLAVLPDVSTILASKSTTLNGSSNAVNGTPPKFKEIGSSDDTVTKANLEKYLSGSVSTLVGKIQAAQGTLATIKPLVDEFRAGQAKCQVIQDAARSLQEMSSRTTSACMMSKIGKAGQGVLSYTSGTKLDDGAFFSPTDADVVRSISMGGTQGDGTDSIMFNIQGKNTEAGIFQIKLTFCGGGKSKGYDKIRVDNNAGTMTYTTVHSSSESRDNRTQTFKSYALLKAGLKASGDSYVFNPDAVREMTMQNYNSDSTGSSTMSGVVKISGETLSSKLYMTGSFTNNGQTMSHSSRSYGEAQFTGTGFSDATIYSGAGRRVGSFTDGSSRKNSMDQSVGFEFDSAKTPQYNTITSSTYITNVAAVNFDTDTVLKTEPTAPDVTTMTDADCAQTPSSVYAITQNANMKAAQTACDNHFHNGDRLCDGLRDQENNVWAALRSTSGGGAN